MIKKFKLNGNGFRGAVTTFKKVDLVGDKDYESLITRNNSNTVPQQLIEEMAKLRIHVLKLSDFWKENWDSNYDFKEHRLNINKDLDTGTQSRLRKTVNECFVTGIDFGENKFIVHFTMPRTDNPRVKIKISTELVSADDGYENFDEMHEIVQVVADLAMKYVNLEMVADESMIAYNVIRANSELTDDQAMDVFEKMSEEKRGELLSRHAESNGFVDIQDILDGVVENGVDFVEKAEFDQEPEELEENPTEDESPFEDDDSEKDIPEEKADDDFEEKAEVEVKPKKGKKAKSIAVEAREEVVIPSKDEEEGF